MPTQEQRALFHKYCSLIADHLIERGIPLEKMVTPSLPTPVHIVKEMVKSNLGIKSTEQLAIHSGLAYEGETTYPDLIQAVEAWASTDLQLDLGKGYEKAHHH